MKEAATDAAREYAVVVVGVGNELLGDEGLGVHVARDLVAAGARLPGDVRVLEAGTALLDVAPECARAVRLIVVDAIRTGAAPGTLHRLSRERALAAVAPRLPLSLHAWGVAETFQAMERLGMLPRSVEVIGAEPGRIEPRLDLSPPLERARRRLVARLIGGLSRPGSPVDDGRTSEERRRAGSVARALNAWR